VFAGEWKGVAFMTKALMIGAVILMLAAVSAKAFLKAT